MNINIDKITLKIKDQILELTLEEVKELHSILDKLIDKKPEFTISSKWPIGGGTINVPFKTYKTSDYPFPQPVITWCGTNETNKDYSITATNQN